MKWGIHSRNAENSLRIGIGLKAAIALLAVTGNAFAVVHYVSPVSPAPAAPYTTWASAARNIQDAVDAAGPGDTILVTNGVYATGGRAFGSSLTNRVTINKPLIVQSVNGPVATVIQGNPTIGTNAVRCVFLTNNATLIGFTLAKGGTYNTGSLERNGGGAWCEGSNAVISQCVFTNNTANSYGGGAFNGILNNCLLIGNSASRGGAVAAGSAHTAILNNCTIVSNSASTSGGGLASLGAGAPSYLWARNCIITENSAPTGPNYAPVFQQELAMDYCCTTPMPPAGSGNFTISHLFANPAAGNFHLQTNSPCINAGNNSYQTNSVDLDGNPRLVGNFVDIGAYEYQAAAPVPLIPGGVQASYTGVSTGIVVTFMGQIAGHPDSTRWDFKDGTVISNQLPTVAHSWNAPGDYDVTLWGYDASHPNGVSASITVHVLEQPVQYVMQTGTNPIPPYLTWDTAATNVQDAVDAAYINGTVVVSNGTYSSGGRAITNIRYALSLSNRVAVIKPITLQSLNGPSVTTIQGYQVPGTTNGASAVRCVYLTNNASLIGFTLTGGATLIYNGASTDYRGVQSGGVDCEAGASVSNCIITGNCADISGGGASGGTLFNCVLTGNCAKGGGGAYLATLNNCVVSGNSAAWGGGISGSTANNCLLIGNSAAQGGGGSYRDTLNNCTVVNNLALVSGGGAYTASLNNSIVYNNSAPEGTNYTLDTLLGGSLQSCCTTPLPPGYWNFTNAPAFIDEASGNFRLQTNSPCINAGNKFRAIASVDLDGNPRIVGGTIDVGAYESQVYSSLISYAWLLQYGLPTDGSADALDPDGDGMNNWQEWIAGTVPTNAASVLKMLSPSKNSSGLQLTWQSVTGKTYFLQRSTNLAGQPAFLTIQTNLLGQTNTTAFTDSGATNQAPYFYRVAVQ
jgi:PKD domain